MAIGRRKKKPETGNRKPEGKDKRQK